VTFFLRHSVVTLCTKKIKGQLQLEGFTVVS